MNLILVGFMGSGKTAVGEALAKDLNLKYVDSDDVIELEEKRKINQIFAVLGEPYFRKIEREVIRKLSQGDKQVIATGGGVMVDEENKKNLKQNGKIVYLRTDPDSIWQRVKNETHRPLLKVENPKMRIKELLDKREPYYRKADITIDTSALSVKEVVEEIKRKLDLCKE